MVQLSYLGDRSILKAVPPSTSSTTFPSLPLQVQSTVEELFGRAQSKSVNPDEVVAVGARCELGVSQV